jgi:hypothetical protein
MAGIAIPITNLEEETERNQKKKKRKTIEE